MQNLYGNYEHNFRFLLVCLQKIVMFSPPCTKKFPVIENKQNEIYTTFLWTRFEGTLFPLYQVIASYIAGYIRASEFVPLYESFYRHQFVMPVLCSGNVCLGHTSIGAPLS